MIREIGLGKEPDVHRIQQKATINRLLDDRRQENTPKIIDSCISDMRNLHSNTDDPDPSIPQIQSHLNNMNRCLYGLETLEKNIDEREENIDERKDTSEERERKREKHEKGIQSSLLSLAKISPNESRVRERIIQLFNEIGSEAR